MDGHSISLARTYLHRHLPWVMILLTGCAGLHNQHQAREKEPVALPTVSVSDQRAEKV